MPLHDLLRRRARDARRAASTLPSFERLESRQVLATFHVTLGGDDLANGSETAPFRSIQRGLDAALEPGDTVLVHEGRYAERVVFRAGGSVRGGAITLAAAPG
ncbi:MAG: hypothetical protein EBS51_01620, partial [Planctomycetia bacterium]|nr:hypothetical protein [Planctomycetia bacterium]